MHEALIRRPFLCARSFKPTINLTFADQSAFFPYSDNIEYNVTSIATNTQAADRELVSASDYQRKAGKRAACLMLVVGFVIAVVLLAVSML